MNEHYSDDEVNAGRSRARLIVKQKLVEFRAQIARRN
jgi:hypothetical protein